MEPNDLEWLGQNFLWFRFRYVFFAVKQIPANPVGVITPRVLTCFGLLIQTDSRDYSDYSNMMSLHKANDASMIPSLCKLMDVPRFGDWNYLNSKRG